MSLLETLVLLVIFCLLSPPLAYLIVKFGAAGYFRAKHRLKQQQQKKRDE